MHEQFGINADGVADTEAEVRGLGTDIAVAGICIRSKSPLTNFDYFFYNPIMFCLTSGSMVFAAQFILSMCMGSIVSWCGTTTAVVSVASFLSFCGAISATQIMYLDL